MSKDPTLSRLELLQGTLDFIVLQTLRWGPRHGYGIPQMIRANSNNMLQVETGPLYPALHRLTKKKWLTSAWSTSENGQRVRVYTLTAAGEEQLPPARNRLRDRRHTHARVRHRRQHGDVHRPPRHRPPPAVVPGSGRALRDRPHAGSHERDARTVDVRSRVPQLSAPDEDLFLDNE